MKTLDFLLSVVHVCAPVVLLGACQATEEAESHDHCSLQPCRDCGQIEGSPGCCE